LVAVMANAWSAPESTPCASITPLMSTLAPEMLMGAWVSMIPDVASSATLPWVDVTVRRDRFVLSGPISLFKAMSPTAEMAMAPPLVV
jgi:hypothetical protein